LCPYPSLSVVTRFITDTLLVCTQWIGIAVREHTRANTTSSTTRTILTTRTNTTITSQLPPTSSSAIRCVTCLATHRFYITIGKFTR
jgi:hypothetical protein